MIAGVRAGDIINGYEVCSWVLLFIVRGEGRAISHLCFTSPVLLLFVLYASDHCRFLPVAKATETYDSQTYMSSTRVGVCAFELAPKKRRQRSGGGASLHETAAEYILRSIETMRNRFSRASTYDVVTFVALPPVRADFPRVMETPSYRRRQRR